MPRILTTPISGSQCIGDSLPIINNNYEALDTVVYALSTNTISPSSTATITPVLLPSTTSFPWTKILGADVNDNSITAAKLTNNSVTTAKLANNSVTPSKLSTGAPTWDTSSNVGIGTTSPNQRLTVSGNVSASGTITTTAVSSVSGFFTNLSVSLSSNTAIGTYIGKFPIFTASGALLGHVPIYNP